MPTPVFCCGGECGVIAAGTHWTQNLGTNTFSTTTVRTGARSIRANPTAATQQINSPTLIASSIWAARVYVYFATLPNSGPDLFTVTINGVNNGLGFVSTDNTLRAMCAGFTAADGIVVTTGRWYLVDIRVNASANPWTADISVDGVPCTQRTFANAANTGTQWNVGNSNTNCTMDVFFDDILVTSDSNDYPLGGGYVHPFVPTTDGAHNVAGAADFSHGAAGADITNATTDAWTLVDDIPLPTGTPSTTDLINCLAPPNATDYVEVKFGPAPTAFLPLVAPRFVEMVQATHEAGTGVGISGTKMNIPGDGSLNVVTHNRAGATTFRYDRYGTRVTYFTGSAWTPALFNDLRAQFGLSSDANPDQYLDAIMLEAEFPDNLPPALNNRPSGVAGERQMRQLIAT